MAKFLRLTLQVSGKMTFVNGGNINDMHRHDGVVTDGSGTLFNGTKAAEYTVLNYNGGGQILVRERPEEILRVLETNNRKPGGIKRPHGTHSRPRPTQVRQLHWPPVVDRKMAAANDHPES